MRITQEQRERIMRAAKEFPSFPKGNDVVDYAIQSGNYFWTGLNDRQTRIALRLIAWGR